MRGRAPTLRAGRRRGDDGRDDDRDRRGVRGRWASRPGSHPIPRRSRPRRGRACSAIGFVASFLAIQTFYAGARRIGAAQAALVSTVEPVYIVVLSGISWTSGSHRCSSSAPALILIGVVIAQTCPRPRGAPEPATPLEAEAEVEA